MNGWEAFAAVAMSLIGLAMTWMAIEHEENRRTPPVDLVDLMTRVKPDPGYTPPMCTRCGRRHHSVGCPHG